MLEFFFLFISFLFLLILVSNQSAFLSLTTIVTLSLFIGFVVRSLVLFYTDPIFGSFSWYFELTSEHDAIGKVALNMSLAILFFIAGFLSKKARVVKKPFAWLLPNIANRANNLIVWSILLTVLSWCFFVVLISLEHGSLLTGINNLQKRAIIFGSKTMVARIFLTFSFVFLIVAITIAWSNTKNLALKLLFIIMIMVQVSLVFLTGGRGATLMQLFIIVLVINYTNRGKLPSINLKYSINAIFGFAFACLVIVYGYSTRLASQTGSQVSEQFALIAPQIARLISDTFPFVDLLIASQKYVLDNGHTFGSNYLAITGRLIPRDLWADKPNIMGLQLREHFYGDSLSGIPPTFFGEAYIAFGLIGVCIASFLLGRFACWFDRIPTAFNQSILLVPFYIYMILQIGFGIVKSGLENSFLLVLYFFIALYILKVLSRVQFFK